MSIITVSVYRSDHFVSLRCRATPLRAVKQGCPDTGMDLFTSERLQYPGFLEFDEVNGIVVSASSKLDVYKVWDLSDYRLRFEIVDSRISDVKISPGILMVIYPKNKQHIPLKFLSVVDGSHQKSMNLLVKRGKAVEFIEQFDTKILVKQHGDNLQIVDIRSMEIVEVSESRYINPSAFVFVDKLNLFMAFGERAFSLYNFSGQMVSQFQHHAFYYDRFSTRFVTMTRDQDMLLSYGRDSDNKGTINLSQIPTGKIIASTKALPAGLDCGAYPVGEDVTSISYVEDRKQLVVGDALGRVFCWKH